MKSISISASIWASSAFPLRSSVGLAVSMAPSWAAFCSPACRPSAPCCCLLPALTRMSSPSQWSSPSWRAGRPDSFRKRSVNGSKPKAKTAKDGAPLWPGLTALALATLYLIALLAAERQTSIIFLLIFAIAAVAVAAWFRLLAGVSCSFGDHEDALGRCAIVAALAVAAFFHGEPFALLLVTTVLVYSVATLGLNIQ